jgi:hypothetical protein
MAHQDILSRQPIGHRKPISSQAYMKSGALNSSLDFGVYLLPIFTGQILQRNNASETEAYGILEELLEDFDTGKHSHNGSLMSHIRRKVWSDTRTGSVNTVASILHEIGLYFADFEELAAIESIDVRSLGLEIEGAYDLSAAALKAGLEILSPNSEIGPSVSNDYAKEMGGLLASQARRRYYGLAFSDLYRQVKTGEINYPEAENVFAVLQLEYIDAYRDVIKQGSIDTGIAFEWLVELTYRHYIFCHNLIGSAYVRYATPREDFPEDNIRGGQQANRQSVDVVAKFGSERVFVQCKMKSDGLYAHPIEVVKAKFAISEADKKSGGNGFTSDRKVMKFFDNTVSEIAETYTRGVVQHSSLQYEEFEGQLVGEAFKAAA